MSETRSKAEASKRTPEEIREEIELTREELGETVAAAAEKADVKKQAQAKVDDAKGQAKAKVEDAKDQAKAKIDGLKAAAPETPREGLQQAQSFAKKNPKPLGIAAALVALFLLWRLVKS
ncbi:MAG TPA: DUF3618 domain-containing protein [Solirubrobacterales bacterium]|jgi:ElaB/YqjD/DUF883 family membrane-anchored ribosome-binding protein